MNKKSIEILDKTINNAQNKKYGVSQDVFEQIASQYALHQIKDEKDPKEAAKKFKEIVSSFLNALN